MKILYTPPLALLLPDWPIFVRCQFTPPETFRWLSRSSSHAHALCLLSQYHGLLSYRSCASCIGLVGPVRCGAVSIYIYNPGLLSIQSDQLCEAGAGPFTSLFHLQPLPSTSTNLCSHTAIKMSTFVPVNPTFSTKPLLHLQPQKESFTSPLGTRLRL